MKLVLYGNFEVPYCSEVHYKRSLESLGHEVVALQENRIGTDDVLAASLESDALIWVHTHSFRNRGNLSMDDVLGELKAAGVPSIAYHLDLYVPLKRWSEYEDSPYFHTEYWFTVDKLMADLLNERGTTKAHFIPAGVLADECYISDQPSPHANDVVFVGSKGYHPEWPHRRHLIEFLQLVYGDRFTHVGGDGTTGTLRGDDLNRMYANSKVAVGDTLCMGFDYPYYASDRLFECPGRGGFNLFPRITGITDWYTENSEIVLYDFAAFIELKDTIDYYLTHDDERENIRRAGHERTKQEHTYAHRWATILDTVFAS